MVQIAFKQDETEKYYNVYNTMDKKRNYLAKEESFIASMYENFDHAMSSKSSRAEYLEQCNAMVSNIHVSTATLPCP